MICPCCQRPVAAPTLEMIIDKYQLGTQEGLILEAVWRGGGHSVSTRRIFDVMFRDDENGGPSETQAYNLFKYGLHRLRRKLRGSGVSVANCGYARGYRLTMKGRKTSGVTQ
jgi:hypothetical protein